MTTAQYQKTIAAMNKELRTAQDLMIKLDAIRSKFEAQQDALRAADMLPEDLNGNWGDFMC